MRTPRILRAGRICLLLGAVGLVIPAAALADPAPTQWPEQPEGFASTAGEGLDSTTGGAGGEVVTVTTQQELAEYAAAEEPYVIRVADAITIEPFGEEIRVASNKTILGVGTSGEIVQGGFFLENVQNVIIRNLTIRDAADPEENDYDGIQIDNSHHVWIDHNRLTRMGDGLIDSRMDSSYITVSWNILEEHNKAFGIGWTDNVTALMTIHHNRISGTEQRNPSADNLDAVHLYNNHLRDVSSYGNYARGQTRMVLENGYFENVRDPYYPDPGAELVESGSIVVDSEGRQETAGEAFDPSSYYDYTLDPADQVPALLDQGAGPQPDIGVE